MATKELLTICTSILWNETLFGRVDEYEKFSISNHVQATLDLKLSSSQKFEYVHILYDSERNEFYWNLAHSMCKLIRQPWERAGD